MLLAAARRPNLARLPLHPRRLNNCPLALLWWPWTGLVDVWHAIAILEPVLQHFGVLPLGVWSARKWILLVRLLWKGQVALLSSKEQVARLRIDQVNSAKLALAELVQTTQKALSQCKTVEVRYDRKERRVQVAKCRKKLE